jgi:5-methyltetrahydrofolate--homocysteine methyltransferase
VSFLERVFRGAPLLLDGGMGSALIARGLERGEPPELWNLEHRDRVADVHRTFVAAGSDAVQTNTFGATPIRLEHWGLASRAGEINRAAVVLARQSGARFVIGDIGPTGEYLPPVGHGDEARWREAFEAQAAALADAGVDAFHVETMSDVREAKVAILAARSAAPGVPVLASITFERKKRGFFSVMGDPLVAALRALSEAGASVVGANCSVTSEQMLALVEEAVHAVEAPLVIQPNAGSPELEADGSLRYAQLPEQFAEHMAAIAQRGVRVLGGCCGTSARFIQALRRRLEAAA